MHTNPNEILVKRSDLLPIEEEDDYFLAGGMIAHHNDDPDELEQIALRYLSAVVHLRDLAAEKAAQEAKEWELEHAVPLARTLYNAYHRSSDPHHTEVGESTWLTNYQAGNYAATKWVGVATTALKSLES